RQIDDYQNRIREINDDVRRQVDIAFEGAAEADQGYAGIFRGHAETVREQMRTVQTMLQVMQSANRTGVDIKALVHGMRPQPEGSREEQLESGRRALLNHLQVRGNTDSTVQQEICDLITKEQPYMVENLYMADFCGSEDTGEIYNLIMECYTDRKTEMTFKEYLGKYGVTDPAEQQEIYGMLLEKQPSIPQELYRAVREGSGDAEAIFSATMDYYNKHKMDITIEDLEGLDMGERMDQTQRETFVACWNKLGQMEISKDHMIAVMACIFAESRFSATNAQGNSYKGLYDDYEFKTGDNVGYGILQWTYNTRKEELLKYANDTGGSVHDLETQLGYFQYEMEKGICRGKWPVFLNYVERNEAIRYFWRYILISGNSLLGKGNQDYEKAFEEHIEFADNIEDWYVTTFQQK
ncbi:MAG: hypothetical protein K1W26_15050, partial [Acetatifactor sp.]